VSSSMAMDLVVCAKVALKVPSVTSRTSFYFEKSKKSVSTGPLICDSVEIRRHYVGGDLSHTFQAHNGGGVNRGVILTMKKPISCRARDAKIMFTLDGGNNETVTERTMTERRMAECRMTERRMTERRMTERRMTEGSKTERRMTERIMTEGSKTELRMTERSVLDTGEGVCDAPN
jgi:hypothetical protein